ncbi:MAG: helix-turn-helix domain-containing protein [Candidatus Gastranaerophilales bacterium]|nr:helix-turn-helix domain-containing protein [Candidatus Gastranaerophilales bacterium]
MCTQFTSKSAENFTSFDLNKAVTFSKIFSKIKLSASSKLTLRALIDCWNPKKGFVFPSQNFLAQVTGLTDRSIRSSVAQLKDEGLILTAKTRSGLNYRFTQKFFEQVNSSCNGGKLFLSHAENSSCSCKEQINNKKNNSFNFSKNSNGNDLNSLSTTTTAFNKKSAVNNFSNYQANFIPPQLKGPSYLPYKKPLLEQKKSPLDDFNTAKIWLENLSGQALTQDFIKSRVINVLEKWNKDGFVLQNPYEKLNSSV